MKLEKIVYSLYQVNEITEKVYNDSIKLENKMNTIFMNSDNDKHLIHTDYYSIFQI